MKPFMGLQEIETHRYLKRLLKNPDDFSAHIRKSVALCLIIQLLTMRLRTAGAIILRIGYGYQVADGEDPFVALADRATDQFSASTAPGGFLVNTFPSCAFSCGSLLICMLIFTFSAPHTQLDAWGYVQKTSENLGGHAGRNGDETYHAREGTNGRGDG